MSVRNITTDEFNWISRFLYDTAGIQLKDGKQALVMGRLDKRLRHFNMDKYAEYFHHISKPDQAIERNIMIDLLTTNETYFFREPKHFEFLKQTVFPHHPVYKKMRLWSAASSSGEEAYTLAMTLADSLPNAQWEIVGTDLSGRMLEKARNAFYPIQAAEKIPERLLKKYCLKGKDDYAGFFRVDALLRNRVSFKPINLVETLPDLGMFDIIFLRNVMIYFDHPTKQKLIERIQNLLLPGGYFFISHSETLNSLETSLQAVSPSIYRKPTAHEQGK